MFCQEFKGHALSRSAALFIRLRCKQWNCEYCAKVNAHTWRKHLSAYVAQSRGDGWSLITITARSRAHRHGTTLEAIIKHWNRLMMRLKNDWGKFQYVRVYEKHASGNFHAHMLVKYVPSDAADKAVYKSNRYRGVAHRQLKRHAFAVGLGYICDFSPILITNTENEEHAVNRVVSYVTKYLVKGFTHGLPKHTRRIQASRAIGSPHPDGVIDDFKLVYYLGIGDVAEIGVIRDTARKHDVTFDDFLEHHVYPPEDAEY